jgi:hypothetical protein
MVDLLIGYSCWFWRFFLFLETFPSQIEPIERFTAGAAGFFIFSQSGERPER